MLGAAVALSVLACSKKDSSSPAPARSTAQVGSGSRPATWNFVLVTIDTLRADAVGAYGGEWKTPHLDAFAEESMLFQHAFATAPFTGPSHASILTSRHPSKHGVIFNGNRVRGSASQESVFVSEHLKDQGYATAAIVSMGPTSERYGFGRGFDYFDDDCWPAHGDNASDGACIIDRTRRWLERRRKDQRFFVWVHLFDPHFPYVCPAGMYQQQGLDPKEFVVRTKRRLHTMPAEQLRKAYLADVYEADHHFGQLLQIISDLGLRPTTVIGVTSDHGEYLGEHGLYGHSRLYDEVLHVPLMIAAPGLRPERRSDLVSIIDLAPTALDLLGLPPMPSAQGRSVVQQSASSEVPPVFAEWRDFGVVCSEHEAKEGDFQLSIRTDDEKLIIDWLFPDAGSQLFDLEKDPHEQENLYRVDGDEADTLGDALERHIKKDLDPNHLGRSDIEIDPQAMKMLRALGYVE